MASEAGADCTEYRGKVFVVAGGGEMMRDVCEESIVATAQKFSLGILEGERREVPRI